MEFWVDNLNPLFLHPEMSKEIDLSTLLMQALSRHLRPAPYPYGLLTLRLLGKLGGRNRQFLRCPMALEYHQREEPQIAKDPYIECKWNRAEESASKMLLNSSILIPIPLSHCLKMLKMIATVQTSSKTKCDSSFFDTNTCLVSHTESSSVLWSSRIEDIDLEKYRKDFVSSTLRNQATACFAITRTFIREKLLEASPFLKKQNSGMINNDFVLLKSSNVKHACIILCYACVINDIKDDALALLKDFVKIIDKKIFAESIVIFVSDPSEVTTEIGIKLLSIFLNPAESHRVAETMDALESTANALIASLCETCRSSEWCRYGGLHEAILFVMNTVGCEWSRKHEVMLVNVAMMCIKTVPRELSLVATKSLRFYMLVCTCLYGTPLLDECNDDLIIDMFSSDKRVGNKTQSYRQSKTSEMTDLGTKVNKRIILPCEDVFRIIVFELASPQHLVR